MGVPCVKESHPPAERNNNPPPAAPAPQALSPRGSPPGFSPVSPPFSSVNAELHGEAVRSPFAAASISLSHADADDTDTGPPDGSGTAATEPPDARFFAVPPRSQRSSVSLTSSSHHSRGTSASSGLHVVSRRTRQHRRDTSASSFASVLDELSLPQHGVTVQPVTGNGENEVSGRGSTEEGRPTTASASSSVNIAELAPMDRESARKAMFEAVAAASPTLKILRMRANRASMSLAHPHEKVGDGAVSGRNGGLDDEGDDDDGVVRRRSHLALPPSNDGMDGSTSTAAPVGPTPRNLIDVSLE